VAGRWPRASPGPARTIAAIGGHRAETTEHRDRRLACRRDEVPRRRL